MTTHRLHTAVQWLLLPIITLALATSAYADGAHPSARKSAPAHDAMPGMSAAEHAQMSGGGHDAMPGMSPGAHAQMSGGGHDAMPGMSAAERVQMSGHDEEAAAGASRPVALVLGGFGLFIGLVLLYAAVLRRRPAARKRLATLARVRASAGKRTVTPTPTASETQP